MSAFHRAWAILKVEDDDIEPDDEFHRLNDPNPTIAFGAAVRNHPFVEEMRLQREEAYSKPYSEGGAIHECEHCGKRTDTNYEDIQNDRFCSSRCSQGLDPFCSTKMGGEGQGPQMCQWKVSTQPGRYDPEGNGYYVALACDDCGNELDGWLS